jgi:hypothetical protein
MTRQSVGPTTSFLDRQSEEDSRMTRKIAGTCFAALFGFALTATAQTPPSSPTDPQQPPSAAAPMPQDHAQMPKAKRLTGCVQSGTEAGTFELTNIKGKSGDAAAGGAAAASKAIKLVAAPGVDLSTHIGHTVELTGAWAAPDASAAPASPSSDMKGDMKGDFAVSKVKMVSSTCSAGTN